ncbi:hypothetical protein Tco_0609708, partial [Tanacetum coccineum]
AGVTSTKSVFPGVLQGVRSCNFGRWSTTHGATFSSTGAQIGEESFLEFQARQVS